MYSISAPSSRSSSALAVGSLRLRAVDDEHAAEPELRRGRGRGARVIRLESAERDDRVGVVRLRLRERVFEFPHLVAAEPERDRVVALDQQLGRAPSSARRRDISSTGVGPVNNGTRERSSMRDYSSDEGAPPVRAI